MHDLKICLRCKLITDMHHSAHMLMFLYWCSEQYCWSYIDDYIQRFRNNISWSMKAYTVDI